MAAFTISSNPTYQGVSHVNFLSTDLHLILIFYIYTKIIHLYSRCALRAGVEPESRPAPAKRFWVPVRISIGLTGLRLG